MEGATSKNNCTECPAGFQCDNSTIPITCSPGHYCPFGVDMTPCQAGTFSNVSGAVDSSTCQPCPAGFWCSEVATTNPSQTPCPVGHYCPKGTGGAPSANMSLEPVPCPPGTYRDSVGGASLSDCFPCPAGYYCPDATTVCFNCTDAAVKGQLDFALLRCSDWRSQEEGPWLRLLFKKYPVIFYLERRYPKQNTVARLKSDVSPPPPKVFCPRKKFCAGCATGCSLFILHVYLF